MNNELSQIKIKKKASSRETKFSLKGPRDAQRLFAAISNHPR
jgi:hypothetical protein